LFLFYYIGVHERLKNLNERALRQGGEIIKTKNLWRKKMKDLKKATVTKCVSLLREFIEETQGKSNKKEFAVLALDQLQRVTAGITSGGDPICIETPLIDGAPSTSGSQSTSGGDPICIETPLIDGAPGL
jgi:hypothetical protein